LEPGLHGDPHRRLPLIGDCETAALVSNRGSVDWLCWPRFDSGACFGALLIGLADDHWLDFRIGHA